MRTRPGPGITISANTALLLLIGLSIVLLIASRLRQSVQPVQTAADGARSAQAAVPSQHSLYFQAGSILMGFSAGQISLTTADQVVLVTFVDASASQPEVISSADGPDEGSIAAGLGQVRYNNLWPGITLTCDGGLTGQPRGSYQLIPGANPDRIRIRYNAAAAVEPDGTLSLGLPGGVIYESAPGAWQDFGGQRLNIPVAYMVMETRTGQEVGLNLGEYDPRFPLTIGPVMIFRKTPAGTE